MMDDSRFRELHGPEEIANALHRLGGNLFDQRVNSPEILNQLAVKYSAKGKVITVLAGSQIVGLCAYYDNDTLQKKAFLSILVVDSKMQGNGYGKVLLQEMLKRCERNGMNCVTARVSAKNSRAICFYTENGFSLRPESKDSLLAIKQLKA